MQNNKLEAEDMQNKSKLEMIAALRDFKLAYDVLNKTWVESTDSDINTTEAIRFYPFNKSFDELNVHEWVDATLIELGANVPAGTMVISSKCAGCESCTKVTETITGSPIEDGWFQCISGVEGALDCSPLMVEFHRDWVIDYIHDTDMTVEQDTHEGFANMNLEGNTGLRALTDIELLNLYKEYTGRYE